MRLASFPCRLVRASLVATALIAGAWSGTGAAQTAAAPSAGPATADDAVLLTIFLRHDQSRPLADLREQLARQNFYKAFPPPGTEVLTWNVVMGIGQVVTLRLPASRVREVNRVLENTAWGPYRTEFYLTYDYKAVAQGEHEKAQ